MNLGVLCLIFFICWIVFLDELNYLVIVDWVCFRGSLVLVELLILECKVLVYLFLWNFFFFKLVKLVVI